MKSDNDKLQELAKAFEICADCNKQMVVRKRKIDGQEFFGCPNWPKCDNTESIEPMDGMTYGDAYNGGMFSA